MGKRVRCDYIRHWSVFMIAKISFIYCDFADKECHVICKQVPCLIYPVLYQGSPIWFLFFIIKTRSKTERISLSRVSGSYNYWYIFNIKERQGYDQMTFVDYMTVIIESIVIDNWHYGSQIVFICAPPPPKKK